MAQTSNSMNQDTSNGRGPDEIREDINHTRSSMDRTLDQLSEQLQPGKLLNSVLGFFQEHKPSGSSAKGKASQMKSSVQSRASSAGEQIQEVGENLVEQVRRNPAAAAMIGIGAAWLFMGSQSGGGGARRRGEPLEWDDEADMPMHAGSYVDARTGEPYDESYGEEYRGQAGGSRMGKLKARTRRAGQIVKGKGRSARERGRQYARRGRRLGRQAQEQAQSGYEFSRDRFEDGLDRAPLAMGVGALALGFLAGMVIPSTRREDEFIGEQADWIRDEATEAAATAAMEIHETAKERGMGGKDLGRKVRHVAEASREAARETAKQEGLTKEQLRDQGRDISRDSGKRTQDQVKEKAGSQQSK